MNAIKKLLGIVWIGLGLAAGYYLLINQAIPKFESGKPEDMIPAIITLEDAGISDVSIIS